MVAMAAEGVPSQDIAQRLEVSRPTVQLWRERFLALRLEGLKKDAPPARSYPKYPREKSAGSRAGHSAHEPPRCHSLEHPHHGQGAGPQPDGGSADLGSTRPQASSDQDFQAQPRPTFCRKALRCGRPLSQSSRQSPGLVRRREKPNPSTRSYPTRTADQEGALRDHDARLQAPRHHHTVRRAEHARWQSDRRLHGARCAHSLESDKTDWEENTWPYLLRTEGETLLREAE